MTVTKNQILPTLANNSRLSTKKPEPNKIEAGLQNNFNKD